ncbi:MAG: ATP-binding cassette domain-containing protein [Methanomicrobiaceae archaeon]|nr:ATP-binding cassette domain-containing protein [Methanomicrobiaceae archaeon]
MHILETRDLCHSYGEGIHALRGVNFIAPRASTIAVLGPNGAGKSTLFRHFNGLLFPTSGGVFYRGEAVSRATVREVRKQVGIVFQNPDDQIFSPTVREDVAFGPVNLGLDAETIEHRVDEALSLLGVEHLADRPPHHLSGGEKKRVAIAGVIAMEPQVLVLDEPSSGLDPQGVDTLTAFLRTLPRRFGMTIIFSTHHVDLVPELADYVYVLDRGAVIGKGSVEEIFCEDDLLRRARLREPLLLRLVRILREHGVELASGYGQQEVEDAIVNLIREKE